MIQTFGGDGQRIAIDLSSVRGVVEGQAVQFVYLHGDKEPYTVRAEFDELVSAWRKSHYCECGE